MNDMRRMLTRMTPWLLAITVALLLTVPAQATAPFSAEVVEVEDGRYEGVTRLAWLQGDDASSLTLEITAESVEGILYETRYVDGPEVPAPVIDRSLELDVPIPEDGDEPVEASSASVRLDGVAPGYRLGIRAAQGTTLMGAMEAPATSLHAQDGARMDGSGIRAREGDAGNPGSDANFQVTEIPGPLVVTQTREGPLEYVIEGDLVLEVDEMDLVLTTADGEQTLRTVTHSEAPADGGPQVIEVDGFLRLHLTQARLVLTADDFDGRLQSAVQELHVEPVGRVTFVNAEGLLETVARSVLLDGESYTVADSLPFSAFGRADRIDLMMEPAVEQSPMAQLVNAIETPLRDVSQGVLFAAILVVGFLAAVLAAAVLASPSMGRVEAAIGDGRYRRAAKMAGRILSRHPKAENAQVARAVALAKAGDYAQVIKEVESSLSTNDPSDGVLHYVLGLAYMETGRHKEAAARFQEAMARTPELGPDVERILPVRKRGPMYGYV